MATQDQNEAEIHRIIERWIDALRAKDLDRLMASYETDVVAFDAAAPLRYIGVDAYRKSWGDWFATLDGPIDFELRDLAIAAADHVAFAHGLCHTTAQHKNGPRGDVWMRWTAGWKKIGGVWLLVHEHVSAPFDAKTRAVLHATP
ncbi:MAG TPA: nuclear transport factor 2 family protein [Kofleriaceae bacterium]|nr:nuclear transport factor 2 family protein [Kofleriaceae bacterium]